MSDRFDGSSCRAKIWIGRVKSNCPPEFLENTFKKAGKLIKVETGFPGFAFADYENEEDADEACRAYNKTVIEGVGEVIVSRATQRGYGDACVKRDMWQRGKGGQRPPIGYHGMRSRSRSRRSRSFSRGRNSSRSGSSSFRRQRARRSRSPSSFERTRYRNRSQSIQRKFRPRSRSRSRSRSLSGSIERKFRPKHPSASPEPRERLENPRDRLEVPVVVEEDSRAHREDNAQDVPPYEPPIIKERSPEQSRDLPPEESREPPRERSYDSPRDRSPRDRVYEPPPEQSREPLRERDRSREAIQERSRDASVTRREAPPCDRSREANCDRSRDAYDRNREAAYDRSREPVRREKRREKGNAAIENASQQGTDLVLKDRSSGTSSAVRTTRPPSGNTGQLSIRERASVVQFFDGASARDLLLESAAVLGVPDLFVPEILNGFPHSFQGLSQEGVINLLAVLGNFVSHTGADAFSSSPECSVEVRQTLGINAAGERVIRKTIIVDGSISCSEERTL